MPDERPPPFEFDTSVDQMEKDSVTKDGEYKLFVRDFRDGWKEDRDYWANIELVHWKDPDPKAKLPEEFIGKRYSYFLGIGLQKKNRREGLVVAARCLGFTGSYTFSSVRDFKGRTGMWKLTTKENSKTGAKENSCYPIIPAIKKDEETAAAAQQVIVDSNPATMEIEEETPF